jgi:hypothetical protein
VRAQLVLDLHFHDEPGPVSPYRLVPRSLIRHACNQVPQSCTVRRTDDGGGAHRCLDPRRSAEPETAVPKNAFDWVFNE